MVWRRHWRAKLIGGAEDMPGAKPTAKRQRSTFLYSTEAGTALALLFAYLNGVSKTFTQREGKGRGIDAMSAFWMPYALRQKKVDSLELKQSARNSVEVLSRQIRAICQDFEVESPFEGSYSGKQLEGLVQALIDRGASLPPPAIVSNADRPSTFTPASDDLREVIFVDDEDLLGDLN
jgi:hypothetical protein